MVQNLLVGEALRGHYRGTYLAEAYTVAPSFAVKDDLILRHFYFKSRALEMALRKYLSDLQFLADNQSLFRTRDLQSAYPSGLPSFKGLHRPDPADVVSASA